MHIQSMSHRLRGAIHSALGCLLLVAMFSAWAARIADQSFDDRLRLGNADLVLNGVGLRSVAWLKGFAAGLYLPAKAETLANVLAQSGPKRLQMKMIIDVDTKEFIKAFDTSLKRNNTEAERVALKARVEQFNVNLEQIGKVRKGDVVNLDFIPATGLVISVNGTVRGQPVPGADLYAGLLKIFIGDLPVDRKLKAGLLGDPPA
jgi:flagellar motor switch/type III secretory pathway protein FliN